MNTPRKHTNYSIDEIAQYLQGGMSPAEMHELEKASVQDPFLADAIDGFQSAQLPLVKADLASINNRISGGGAKVVTAAAKTIVWWKTAAAAVLITATGITTWKLLTPASEPKPVASRQTVAPAQRETLQAVQAAPSTKKDTAVLMTTASIAPHHTATVKPPVSLPAPQPVAAVEASIQQTDTALWHEALAAARTDSADRPVSYRSLQAFSKSLPDSIDATSIRAGSVLNTALAINNTFTVTGNLQAPARVAVKDLTYRPDLQLNSSYYTAKKVQQVLRNVNLVDTVRKPVQLNLTGGIARVTGINTFTVGDVALLATKEAGAIKTANTSPAAKPASSDQQFARAQRTTDVFPNPSPNAARRTPSIPHSGDEDSALLARQAAVTLLKSKSSVHDASAYKDTTSYLLVMKENVLNPEYGWDTFKKYFHKKIFEGFGQTDGEMGRVIVVMRLNAHGKVIYADVRNTYGLKSFDNVMKQRVINAFMKGPRWTIAGRFQAGNVATHINL